ncbi:MAG: hypothetical protein K2J77_08200, partial [Oscillospiraceae bacterium]|nr:hypothetical protein [Oscillospiraceae bacterium]
RVASLRLPSDISTLRVFNVPRIDFRLVSNAQIDRVASLRLPSDISTLRVFNVPRIDFRYYPY